MYSYIFDIGGVLLNFDYENIIATLAKRTNSDSNKIERLFHIEYLYPVETGRISSEEFFSTFVHDIMPILTYEEWIQCFTENCTINKPSIELLLQIREKGKAVYLLSNLAEFHKIAWERAYPDIFKICEKNFLSYIMGYHKPEKEIYLEVCKEIRKDPSQCIFFDDTKKNIEGAIDAGLIGIQFSNENISQIKTKINELEP